MAMLSDEVKQEVIMEYKSRMSEYEESQRPVHTLEVVKELAAEYDSTPNGIRMLLQKEGVYIKKSTTASTSASSAPKRMSKEAAHQALKDAISATGQVPNEEVITKLSGVAAQYLTTVVINAMAVGA